MTRVCLIASALCLGLGAAAAVHGQSVSGKVLLAGSGEPLAEVLVTLQTADGRFLDRTHTDTAGAFLMASPRTGMVTLKVERIGLASVVTAPFRVGANESVEVEVRMGESAVPLEPLTVQTRSELDIGPLAGYYRRAEENERLGNGTILTRDVLAQRLGLNLTDVLRSVPRLVVSGDRRSMDVFMRSGRGQCLPRVYINGMYWNRAGGGESIDDLVRPDELEGIEVYSGLAQMPADFYDNTGCGVVLLWTRRSLGDGAPLTWRRALLAGAAIGLLLLFTSW